MEADFVQQLKAEMLEAAEEVGLPGGRWLVDGKPPQSVTTSGPSAPPASMQRPSDQQPASPPKRLRAAQKGLSTGCSEKNQLIETRWQLRQRQPSARAVEGAFHFAETSARISQAQAADNSTFRQAIDDRHDALAAVLNLEGTELEAVAAGFLAAGSDSPWIVTRDNPERAREIDQEIDSQVAAISDLHDQRRTDLQTRAPGLGDEVMIPSAEQRVLDEDNAARARNWRMPASSRKGSSNVAQWEMEERCSSRCA